MSVVFREIFKWAGEAKSIAVWTPIDPSSDEVNSIKEVTLDYTPEFCVWMDTNEINVFDIDSVMVDFSTFYMKFEDQLDAMKFIMDWKT